MREKKTIHSLTLSSKAQEMLMRDVLDGMEDFISRLGFQSNPCEFEIIPIERNAVASRKEVADNNTCSADVISYSEKKQKRLLKLSA